MLPSTCMLVLGFAAAAFAQESAYTGPAWNPSAEPNFGGSLGNLVIPTATDLPAIQPTDAFSMATTISGIILPTTPLSASRSSAATSLASSQSSSRSASSAAASSASSASSASRTASSATSSVTTSAASSAPATQSTAAAVANRAGVMGAVAGGLLAGLALA